MPIKKIPSTKWGLAYILQNDQTGHYLAGTPGYPEMVVHRMHAKIFHSQRNLKTFMTTYDNSLDAGTTKCPLRYLTDKSEGQPLHASKSVRKDSIEKFSILCIDYKGNVLHNISVCDVRQKLVILPV